MIWKPSPTSLVLVLGYLTPGDTSHTRALFPQPLRFWFSLGRAFQASSAENLHPANGFLGSFFVLWLYVSDEYKIGGRGWWRRSRLALEIQSLVWDHCPMCCQPVCLSHAHKTMCSAPSWVINCFIHGWSCLCKFQFLTEAHVFNSEFILCSLVVFDISWTSSSHPQMLLQISWVNLL